MLWQLEAIWSSTSHPTWFTFQMRNSQDVKTLHQFRYTTQRIYQTWLIGCFVPKHPTSNSHILHTLGVSWVSSYVNLNTFTMGFPNRLANVPPFPPGVVRPGDPHSWMPATFAAPRHSKGRCNWTCPWPLTEGFSEDIWHMSQWSLKLFQAPRKSKTNLPS